MRKKQLLATLVMLSLMQGSVYAADKITEKDFDSSNTYTAQTSDVGPIYIIDNKEKDYTINAPDGLNIVDVEHRGIIVSTENSNDNASMSSLTINGNVQIGNNSGVQIVPENELLGYRTSTALVQVGQSTYNGGKLTINGNLNIQNVDFSNVNSLISVSGADGKKNASELNIGSITIDNVTGGNKGIIYTDNKPEVSLAGNSVILDVGDIIVTNSDAGFLIDDGTSYTSILKTGNITLQNVDFTNSAMYLTNLETEGKIIYKSTDEMNLATYGDEFLFYFQPNNNDVISISDGIEIENVKGTYTGWNESGTFYYSGFSSKIQKTYQVILQFLILKLII